MPLLWHFFSAADSTKLAQSMSLLSQCSTRYRPWPLPYHSLRWGPHLDIGSKIFQLLLLVFIPLDVDAPNVKAPYFICTAFTIPTHFSPL